MPLRHKGVIFVIHDAQELCYCAAMIWGVVKKSISDLWGQIVHRNRGGWALIGRFMSVICMIMTLMLSGPLLAQNSDEIVAIQLKTVGLPGITDKGYRGRLTVTPYVEVLNKDVIQRFCGRWPRVIDAILIAFEETPVDLKDKAADLASRQDALGKHIEEAVGIGVFKQLYLVVGSKRRAAGTEVMSSKFGTRECQPIKYLPWEKEVSAPVRQITESIITSQETVQPSVEEQSVETPSEVSEPIRETPAKPFPSAPKIDTGPSWIVITIALIAMSGVTIVVGSYIGYQVAKIRRDRRRKERRQKKKDRRSGLERRLAQGPIPLEGDRRSGIDRRSGLDRREVEKERRANRDRREAAAEEAPQDDGDESTEKT